MSTSKFLITLKTTRLRPSSIISWSETVLLLMTFWLVALREGGSLLDLIFSSHSVPRRLLEKGQILLICQIKIVCGTSIILLILQRLEFFSFEFWWDGWFRGFRIGRLRHSSRRPFFYWIFDHLGLYFVMLLYWWNLVFIKFSLWCNSLFAVLITGLFFDFAILSFGENFQFLLLFSGWNSKSYSFYFWMKLVFSCIILAHGHIFFCPNMATVHLRSTSLVRPYQYFLSRLCGLYVMSACCATISHWVLWARRFGGGEAIAVSLFHLQMFLCIEFCPPNDKLGWLLSHQCLCFCVSET